MDSSTQQSDSIPVLTYLKQGGRAISSHWRTVIVVFIGTFVLIQAIALTLPKKYYSETKILVKVGRESISLDPTASIGSTISMYESRETEIRSLLELVSSRVVLERIVEKMGPEKILDTLPARRANEKAVSFLSKAISIDRGTKSSVITVSMKDRSPEQAQLVLNVFLDVFKELHLKANTTEGSYDFFVSQTDAVQKQYEETNNKLREAKDKVGVSSIAEKKKVLEIKDSELQKLTLVTVADLESAEAEVKSIKEALKAIPQRMETLTRDLPNVSLDPTIKRLHELQLERQQLLSKFTQKHPRVISLTEQITEANELLTKNEEKRSELNNNSNPTYQHLEEKLLLAEARATGLRARQASLLAQKEQLFEEIKGMNLYEGEIASLTQQTEVLLEKLSIYANKKEEARMNMELSENQISNVNVFQPPTFLEKPVSPRNSLILIAGFLLSLLNALLVPLLMEYGHLGALLPNLTGSVLESKLVKTS